MDILAEAIIWGVTAIVFSVVLALFLPSFLSFLAKGDIDKSTGIKKHFFWNGKED